MSKRKDPSSPLWEQLSKKLLSREGMDLVDADPNLTARTILALQKTEQSILDESCKNGGYKWYFSLNEDGSDTSAALLASCINDNPLACMAELVARYASLRNMPFYTVAAKLCQLRDNGCLYRLNDRPPYTYIPWFPTPTIPVIKKTKRRANAHSNANNEKAANSVA